MSEKRLPFIKNASYNTIGIIVYDFCLWLTTLAVVRLSPDYVNAGIWQLSISITNVFAVFAAFNLATFYVSDVNNENSLEHYLGAQFSVSLLSALVCAAYAVLCGYEKTQLLCIVIYMVARSIEAFSGFLFGIDQRNYRMDYVGISFALRGILGSIAFCLVLYYLGNLVIAVSSMGVMYLLILMSYDIPVAKRFEKLKMSFRREEVIKVILKCLPSVISISAFTAVSTIARQMLEYIYDEKTIGYYSTVAAPMIIIQVVVISVFTPLLRDVSLLYKSRQYSAILVLALKMMATLITVVVFGFVGAKYVGEIFYAFLYGPEIKQYCYLLFAIILSVAMYAACWVCWSFLVVMRKTNAMLLFSVLSLFSVILTAKPFIHYFGMNGVSFAVSTSYLLYFILSLVYILIQLKLTKKAD